MFYLALALFLVAAVAAAYAFFGDDAATGAAVAFVAGLVGVGVLISSMMSFVDTRHVGIVKAYGKPTGRVTGAGLQWTKPWEGTDDSWDATRQSYNHLGDKCEKPGDGSLWVQIAGQRNMCVRVQINWQIPDVTSATAQQHAADLWATYRERDGLNRFQSFEAGQVIPGFNSAVLATFRTFDPLGLIDPKTGESQAPDLAGTYTQKLTDNITQLLGDDIQLKGISWGLVGFDQATTSLVSAYGQKILEQRNLKVDNDNAGTRAKIAASTGVPAAVQQCLDLVKTLGKGEPGLCMGGGQVVTTRPLTTE